MASHCQASECETNITKNDDDGRAKTFKTRHHKDEEADLLPSPLRSRFGQIYQNLQHVVRASEGVRISVLGTGVPLEVDDNPPDMYAGIAGHMLVRECIRVIRDRRHEGYTVQTRVHRKIARRKQRAPRHRSRREQLRAQEGGREEQEEETEEEAEEPSHKSSLSYFGGGGGGHPIQTPHAYVPPVYIPPSPCANTPLATSAQSLLTQLKEIEMHPPVSMRNMAPPESYGTTMGSPESSIEQKKEPAIKEEREGLCARFLNLVGYCGPNSEQEAAAQAGTGRVFNRHGPFDLREREYTFRMSESPSP